MRRWRYGKKKKPPYILRALLASEQRPEEEEIILSDTEYREVTLRWIYATDYKLKRQLFILILLGMGYNVSAVIDSISAKREEVQVALKLLRDQ